MSHSKVPFWKRLICMIFATTLVVSTLAVPADAASIEDNHVEIVNEDVDVSEEVQENDTEEIETIDGVPVNHMSEEKLSEIEQSPEQLILSEVEEEREEDSKTFALNDGSFLVAQYNTPVHYETEDGSWEEIDVSVEETDEGTDEEGYETTEKAGKRDRIKFSKKLKEGKTVSIKNTEFPISWGLVNAQMQTVKIQQQEINVDDTEILSDAEKHNNKFLSFEDSSELLLYEDIYEEVDVTYEVMSVGIKENIILKQPGTMSAFEIAYDIGKLEAIQYDSQTINLMKDEEIIYQIQAPYMQDDAGEQSEDVEIEITELNNKKMIVTVTADEKWLLDEERVYPVILDPVIMTKTEKSAITTTFVASGVPTTNFSQKKELIVGRESSEYINCRILAKFELPKLKPGDMVVDAELDLGLYKMDFYSSGTPGLQVNAHRLKGSWTLSGVNWNNQPKYESTVLDYNVLDRADLGTRQHFDITEVVKGWYEGLYNNYGILLKSYNEDGSNADVGVKSYFWPERYNEQSNAYPVIQIVYRNNKGLEDYWSYTALSAGTAGTAYVNDYTGNLVFIHEDVSTTGNLMPVTVQHVYNGYIVIRQINLCLIRHIKIDVFQEKKQSSSLCLMVFLHNLLCQKTIMQNNYRMVLKLINTIHSH